MIVIKYIIGEFKNMKKKTMVVAIVLCIILGSLGVNASTLKKEQNIHKDESYPPSEKEWTLMLYFGGDQEEEWPEAKQMIDMALNSSYILNSKINVVFLIDFGKAFFGRMKITRSCLAKFEIIEEFEEINVGNYTTLRDFILRSKTDYPAERYFLHIHGHGAGWYGGCFDSETNETNLDTDHLTMNEMRRALDESGGVDIVEYTNCLMGSFESAYELQDCTEIYIGSEESVDFFTPALAVLYNIRILRRCYHMTNIEIAERIVERFRIFNPYLLTPLYLLHGTIHNRFTMSAVRTDKLDGVCIAVDDLAREFIENIDDYKDIITEARLQSEDFPGFEYPLGSLIDLYHYSDLLQKSCETSESDLYIATQNVKQSLDEAVISEWHQNGHKHAHGLSLFFPPDNSDVHLNTSILNMNNYKSCKLEFTKDTQWDEFLALYLDLKN